MSDDFDPATPPAPSADGENAASLEGYRERLLEALLFASAEPLTEASLAKRLGPGADVSALLADLRNQYAERGVNLVQVGGGWAFRTAPDLARHLRTQEEVARKLSRAAIETLAIIAYHQPVTRGEIERIRGVATNKGTLDILIEQGWVVPAGRKETAGRPLLWATSSRFLDHFNLASTKELPRIDELRAMGYIDSSATLYGMSAAKSDETDDTDDDAESEA